MLPDPRPASGRRMTNASSWIFVAALSRRGSADDHPQTVPSDLTEGVFSRRRQMSRLLPRSIPTAPQKEEH